MCNKFRILLYSSVEDPVGVIVLRVEDPWLTSHTRHEHVWGEERDTEREREYDFVCLICIHSNKVSIIFRLHGDKTENCKCLTTTSPLQLRRWSANT